MDALNCTNETNGEPLSQQFVQIQPVVNNNNENEINSGKIKDKLGDCEVKIVNHEMDLFGPDLEGTEEDNEEAE